MGEMNVKQEQLDGVLRALALAEKKAGEELSTERAQLATIEVLKPVLVGS